MVETVSLYIRHQNHTFIAAATLPTTTRITTSCSKCGVEKNTGILSCCALGGSWFSKCGSASSGKQFEHTWLEGIRACASKLGRWLR